MTGDGLGEERGETDVFAGYEKSRVASVFSGAPRAREARAWAEPHC